MHANIHEKCLKYASKVWKYVTENKTNITIIIFLIGT